MKHGFSMPNAAPLYTPPPYVYKGNTGFNIVFLTAPEVLQALVPSPLIPNPGNFTFLYAGEFNIDQPVRLNYLEVGIGVPVFLNGKPGSYFVYLYLDKAPAIVGGREIWGWPKKDAEIQFKVEGKRYQVSVARDGVEIVRAAVNVTEPVVPIPEAANMRAFNLKIIPSVQRNHPPDVLQLTSAGGTSVRKELFTGEATLSFASAPNDPLGDIPVLGIISAEQYVEDMTLDCGEVLVDYLKENT